VLNELMEKNTSVMRNCKRYNHYIIGQKDSPPHVHKTLKGEEGIFHFMGNCALFSLLSMFKVQLM